MTQGNYPYPYYSPAPGISGCPNCQQVDSVKKVSSIVSAGTTYTRSVGTSGGVSFNRNIGTSYNGGINSSSGVSMNLTAQQLMPPAQPKAATALLTFAIILIVIGFMAFASSPGAGFVLLAIGAGLGFLYYQDVQSVNKNKLPRYQRAIAKWNALFYCARCDGVFITNSQLVPIGYMHSFLNS